jgi:hypothetical protein
MKKTLISFLSMALLLVGASFANASMDTFNDDNQGWKTYGVHNRKASYLVGPTDWTSQGGNGYITMDVGDFDRKHRAYSFASGSYFGDLQGKTLSVDFKKQGDLLGNTHARLYIGDSNTNNYFVTDALWNAAASTSDWTTHTVSMDQSNWTAWINTSGSLSDLLDSYDSIGLIFTDDSNKYWRADHTGLYASGSGSVSVDNFGASVPVPAAIWLFGSGFVGLIGMRRAFRR